MRKDKLDNALTDLIFKLTILEEKLWLRKLSRTKKVYLTTKEIRERMINGEPLPTSIFNSEKRDYGIVKARTIYGPVLNKTRKK